MLLVYSPAAKPCEPPTGIAMLAGALRDNGLPCGVLDANLEALLFLSAAAEEPHDTWGRRAYRNLDANLAALRSRHLYTNRDRYQRAVTDVNRILDHAGRTKNITLSLANYQETLLSPLKSSDLIRAAAHPEENIYYDYFAKRLKELLEAEEPDLIGFSLNYLSQAIPTFAMIGYVRKTDPNLPIVLGGGLVTSWLSNPDWQNPFEGLVDHLVSGPGAGALLDLMGARDDFRHHRPDFSGLPLGDYLSPGLILPYSASSGCYWNRCSFCPERAEQNPYAVTPPETVLEDIGLLIKQTNPVMLHFLDNAISPALLKAMAQRKLPVEWYGFARIQPALTDPDFCRNLRRSGCVMLKLGLESGSQDILDAMNKGINLAMAAEVLKALKNAGIATYVYLLFGTPAESLDEARQTLHFVAKYADCITYLNLAIFNMPVRSPETDSLEVSSFSEGDLSLYTDFTHPLGWDRQAVRKFLDREFKRHPAVAAILRRDPVHFTSNHAPFFAYDKTCRKD
jgi:radical SAM superfamily enzyme YgiQ (UPF0313 family)